MGQGNDWGVMMRETTLLLLACLAVAASVGCAPRSDVADDSIVPDATATAEIDAPPISGEQPIERSELTTVPPLTGTITEESIYEFAAWLFSPYESLDVWRPSWLPEGFEVVDSWPEMGDEMNAPVELYASTVWLEYARGGDRIYHLMALGDYGEEPELDASVVKWAQLDATMVRNDRYYRDISHKTGLERQCTSVRGPLGPIQGVGVTEAEMARIAASMQLVEPTATRSPE